MLQSVSVSVGYCFLMGAQGEKWTNWTGVNELKRSRCVCGCVFRRKAIDVGDVRIYGDVSGDEHHAAGSIIAFSLSACV